MTSLSSAFALLTSIMGTRIYPATRDIRRLEALAGVRPGTAKQLETVLAAERALQAAVATDPELAQRFADRDIGYDIHCVIADSPLDRYQSFLLFGWGRFDLSLLPKNQRVYGSTTDLKLMRDLLASATNAPDDLDKVLALTGGLRWS